MMTHDNFDASIEHNIETPARMTVLWSGASEKSLGVRDDPRKGRDIYRLAPILLLSLFLGFTGTVFAKIDGDSPETISTAKAIQAAADIEVFVREGCPHCARAEEFLLNLTIARPEVRISIRDIGQDALALERLKHITTEHGVHKLSVPAFYLNGMLIVGFSEEAGTGKKILAELNRVKHAQKNADKATDSCVAQAPLPCDEKNAKHLKPEIFEIELFGHTISLDQVGLPTFTLAMGLLDGFNPCSMWVLILMISLLAPMRNRWRMFAIAGVFIGVEGLAYFIFMAAWLNLFLIIGLSRASEIIIAVLALVAGGVHIKDFLAYGRGLSLSIPDSAKPGIYAGIRAILQAENLKGAMISTIILAILVQIVEFLCTSGFPALFTRILTLSHQSDWSYYGYLLLYNAAYLLDDAIVLGIGIATLSQRRLKEKEGRWLQLISGVVMTGLGFYLLFLQHKV